MHVFKWTTNFMVVVNFPQLPVHLFDQSSLFLIARTIGSPMKIYASTSMLARICVEMDMLKRFPPQIWIGNDSIGFWQVVEYNKVQQYCVKCNR